MTTDPRLKLATDGLADAIADRADVFRAKAEVDALAEKVLAAGDTGDSAVRGFSELTIKQQLFPGRIKNAEAKIVAKAKVLDITIQDLQLEEARRYRDTADRYEKRLTDFLASLGVTPQTIRETVPTVLPSSIHLREMQRAAARIASCRAVSSPEQLLVNAKHLLAGAESAAAPRTRVEFMARCWSHVEVEQLLRIIAIHESAHIWLERHCGRLAEAFIEVRGNELVGGVTLAVDDDSLTLFQKSCVGWAGIQAEYIYGQVLDKSPEIPPLSGNALGQWCAAILSRHGGLSLEDRALIVLCADPVASAAYTFRVLTSTTGSSFLYDCQEELLERFRRDYIKLAGPRDALWTAAQRLARQIVNGPGRSDAVASPAGESMSLAPS